MTNRLQPQQSYQLQTDTSNRHQYTARLWKDAETKAPDSGPQVQNQNRLTNPRNYHLWAILLNIVLTCRLAEVQARLRDTPIQWTLCTSHPKTITSQPRPWLPILHPTTFFRHPRSGASLGALK